MIVRNKTLEPMGWMKRNVSLSIVSLRKGILHFTVSAKHILKA
jgi:hypothetical protein